MSALLKKEGLVASLSLAALLWWDFSGLDLNLARWLGGLDGFALRNAWWARGLLHEGGRALSFALMGLMLFDVVYPLRAGPSRAQRAYWAGVSLACVLLVQVLKRASSTSCPWDLAEFGGTARYLSHWQWGSQDGGAGHCFPSGHASAAFVFFSLYFLWRSHHPRLATGMLVGVLATGAAFGATQVLRGAHYPSHVLWSAWLCWSLCVLAAFLQRWRKTPALSVMLSIK